MSNHSHSDACWTIGGIEENLHSAHNMPSDLRAYVQAFGGHGDAECLYLLTNVAGRVDATIRQASVAPDMTNEAERLRRVI